MKKITLYVLIITTILLFSAQKPIYAKSDDIDAYIPVITYHHLAENFDPNQSSNIISPKNFKLHMKYLKAIGFTTITFYDLQKVKEGILALPENPILITFDDGYSSNYNYAYPILKELNMKATINIVVSTVGQTPGMYPHFTWEQAKEMLDSEVIEIGSHSYNLHTFDLLKSEDETDSEYYQRLYEDFHTSRNTIKDKLSVDSKIFCSPYGFTNETISKAVKDAGFNILLTTKKGVFHTSEDLMNIKRINADGRDTPQELLKKIYEFIPNKYFIPLSDIDSTSEDFIKMLTLFENNIVKGNSDGSFKLDDYISLNDIKTIAERMNKDFSSILQLTADDNKKLVIGHELYGIMLRLFPECQKYYSHLSNSSDSVTRRDFFNIINNILLEYQSSES